MIIAQHHELFNTGNIVYHYFPGLPSRIEGVGLDVIAKEILIKHSNAFKTNDKERILDSGGHYHYRRFSEKHLLRPEAIVTLQKALREGDYVFTGTPEGVGPVQINDQFEAYIEEDKLLDFNVK